MVVNGFMRNAAPRGLDVATTLIEIEVTPEMIAAGLEEIREHRYGDDLRYTLESVFEQWLTRA